MAFLEVHAGGEMRERRELSRTQPLSIGRLPFNDLTLSGEDVPAMHSRISWQKDHYLITAATKNGVEVNGAVQTEATLRSRDIIRIGGTQLVFWGSEATQKSAQNAPSPEPSLSELSLVSCEVAVVDEVSDAAADRKPDEAKSAAARERADAMAAKLGVTRAPRRQRAVATSPWIMTLTLGSIVLGLVSATLWFIMGREATQQLYDQAVSRQEAGQYIPAIATYDEFLQKYPRHALSGPALMQRGLCSIQAQLAGAAPNWRSAFEQVQGFVKRHRGSPEFVELTGNVRQLVDQLAMGAANTAARLAQAELIPVAQEAKGLFEQLSDPRNPATAMLERLQAALDRAEAAVHKQRRLESTVAEMKRALAADQPLEALEQRQSLLQRYRDLDSHASIVELTQPALEQERSRIVEREPTAATPTQQTQTLSGLMPLALYRIRTEESAGDRTVFVRAKQTLLALDGTSAEVLWRRDVGAHTAFFPLRLLDGGATTLLHDAREQTLVACRTRTGDVVWRQALASPPRGAPLLQQGELYLSTAAGVLLRLEATTGRITGELVFPQPLATGPALLRGEDRLIIAGHAGALYTASLHPFACTAVTFSGHGPGGIEAPLIAAGKLLVACLNTGTDAAEVKVFEQRDDAAMPLRARQPIAGTVLEPPVLRGAQLVVPASDQRLSAFLMNDDPAKPPLLRIGDYRIPSQQRSPLFVGMGPDSRFWVAGDGFRRFDIESEQLRLAPEVAAAGLATQPLQAWGEEFYVGRKSPYSDATIFSIVEREKMGSNWRLVAGAAPLEVVATPHGGLLWVNEHGQWGAWSAERLQRQGFDSRSWSELELAKDQSAPLQARALPGGKLSVYAPAPTERVWIIGNGGNVEAQWKVRNPLVTAPQMIGAGLLLLSAERASYVDPLTGKPLADDWSTPHRDALVSVTWTGSNVLLVDQGHRLMRLQPPMGGNKEWISAGTIDLGQPLVGDAVIAGDHLVVALRDGRVLWLEPKTLDIASTLTLSEAPVSLRAVGDAACTLDASGRLSRWSFGEREPQLVWSLELGPQPLAGPIAVVNEHWWLAQSDGAVYRVQSQQGTILSRIELPQPTSLGVVLNELGVLVPAIDGSAYWLDPGQEESR